MEAGWSENVRRVLEGDEGRPNPGKIERAVYNDRYSWERERIATAIRRAFQADAYIARALVRVLGNYPEDRADPIARYVAERLEEDKSEKNKDHAKEMVTLFGERKAIGVSDNIGGTLGQSIIAKAAIAAYRYIDFGSYILSMAEKCPAKVVDWLGAYLTIWLDHERAADAQKLAEFFFEEGTIQKIRAAPEERGVGFVKRAVGLLNNNPDAILASVFE